MCYIHGSNMKPLCLLPCSRICSIAYVLDLPRVQFKVRPPLLYLLHCGQRLAIACTWCGVVIVNPLTELACCIELYGAPMDHAGAGIGQIVSSNR